MNSSPVTYDADLFMSKWKESIDKGLKEFFDSDCFCFVAGYTLKLHGFYFDFEYESKGHMLMERCRLITSNDRLLGFANYNIGNKEFPYKIKSIIKCYFLIIRLLINTSVNDRSVEFKINTRQI